MWVRTICILNMQEVRQALLMEMLGENIQHCICYMHLNPVLLKRYPLETDTQALEGQE